MAIATGFPAAAQEAQTDRLHLSTPSFVFARHATASASSLYAVKGFGTMGTFVAMVQNSRTKYSEQIVGVVTQANWSGQNVLLAASYAEATDSKYIQVYLLPDVSSGRVRVFGTIEWYEPIEPSGTRQLEVNPVTLVVRVSQWIGLGVAYTLGLAEDSSARQRIGPTVVARAPPWGTLQLELLQRISGESVEVRTSVSLSF